MKRALSLIGTLCVCLTIVTAFPTAQAAETPDEFDALRNKFTQMAIGGDYESDTPQIQPVIESINSTAQHYWDELNSSPVSNAINGSYRDSSDKEIPGLDASNDYIFEDYPLGRRRPSSTVYINANSLHFTFQYLRAMATAYMTEGCDLYQNQEMLADIKEAMKFIYENHFNPSIPRYGNWFSWQIGAPVYLGETLMLLYDEFSEEEIASYATAMIHYLGKAAFTGANATWASRVRMYTGILLKDNDWLTYVQNYMPGILQYTTSGDGYYTDGTFVQHDTITYNGGYGLMALTDSAFILNMLSGTKWALSSESSDIVYQWVYDTYEPFVYNGLAMDAFRGREITRYDTTQPRGGLIIANAILMLADSAPTETASDFRSMVKQWFSNDLMIDEMNNGADTPWYKFPLDTAVKVNDILQDDSVTPRSLAGNNYQMNAGARAIHWSDNWTYTIAMTSKRISNCEIGDSNAKGWYTGLGMTHLYNNDMGRYEGVNKATIDWRRLPGTTSVVGKNVSSQTKNLKSFVGGTTLNGKYGTTGFDMSIAPNSLKAKKSWFQFDDEIVAVGSGVSGTGHLETTLENYMLEKDNRTFSIDGQQQSMTMDGAVQDYADAKTVHFEGNVPGSAIGFYLPGGANLKAVSENRTGKWTDLGEYNTDPTEQNADFFTIWQSHGQNPTDDKYAYVLLPGKTSAETTSYAEASDVEILQQDDKAHAVQEKTLGLVGVNFWNNGNNRLDVNGTKSYISSDKAASIMVKETDSQIDLSVADSTQENDGAIGVEINRAAQAVLSTDPGVEVIQTSPSIKLKIDVRKSAGKAFTSSFSYQPVELVAPEIAGMKMSDGSLDVTLKAVPNASSYEVKVGTEPGQYIRTITTKKTVVSIYGLEPGKTYYLAALARNGNEASDVGDEKPFPVPATIDFFDDFEDMSKMVAYSSGWLPDSGDAGKFNGDVTRIKRKDQKVEWFSYMLPSLESFELETYGYNKSIGDIKLYTSTDGVTWIPQDYKILNSASGNEWFKELLTPDGAINAGANYLKIELNSHPTKAWAPQFTKFRATMQNTSDLVTIKDPLINDSRAFETNGIRFVTNSDAAQFGGDTDVAATDEAGRFVYSYTDIQEASIVSFTTETGNTPVFETSIDGNDWAATPANHSHSPAGVSGTKVVSNITAVPEGTNHLRINFDPAVTLSDVTLKYHPDNAPVQKIRFADSALDGVIDYDVTPVLKTAPANGISDFQYESNDEEIASYSDGTIRFVSQGEAEIVATVEGTDVSATLPVKVYRDVALKRSVEVSNAASNYAAANAVNGDLAVSRWQSNTQGQEWLQVDLGGAVAFDAVDIKWYSNGADYDLLVSDNGTDWELLKEVRGAASGDYARFDLDQTVKARYLKMQGIGASQYSMFSIRALQKEAEFPGGIESRNLALRQPATASAIDPNNSSLTADKAVDGDTGTRWASGRTDDQWFMVDLGESAEVDGINISWESAAGREYKVQISDDGQNWTDMVHEKSNTGAGWKRYELPGGYTGRYVRMLGLSRVNTTYGYSMYEFEVMGRTASDKEPKPIEAIAIDPAATDLLRGHSEKLSAVTTPTSNAASISWSSSAPEIVSVSNTGVVKAQAESGQAVITARSVLDEDIRAEAVVTITPYAGEPVTVEAIEITGAPSEAINPLATVTLTAVVSPENATNKAVKWTSSDPKVAVVNANGTVTGIAPGTAKVTATSVGSDISKSVEIQVVDKTYSVVAEEFPVGDADIEIAPTESVAGQVVTVKVWSIEEGYVLTSLSGTYGSDQPLNIRDVTPPVTEAAATDADLPTEAAPLKFFEFDMPAANVSLTVELRADGSALQVAIGQAQTKVEESYTVNSWATLSSAVAEGQEVLDDPLSTKEDVATALLAVTEALDGLVLQEDADTLAVLLSQAILAQEVAAGNLYADDSEVADRVHGTYSTAANSVLGEAIAAAQANEGEIANLIGDLTGALEALAQSQTSVNTADLEQLVSNVSKLVEVEYTPSTWKTLSDKLAEARTLLEETKYSANMVNAIRTALGDSWTSLHRQFAVVTKVSAGKGNLAADEYVPQGEELQLSVEPADGHKLKQLLVNGADVTEAVIEGKVTIPNIQAQVSVEAIFEAVENSEDIIVTPVAPTRKGNVITIPLVEGVEYLVDGQAIVETSRAIEPITITLKPGQSIRVTAQALSGYVFPQDAVTGWSYAYIAPGSGGNSGNGQGHGNGNGGTSAGSKGKDSGSLARTGASAAMMIAVASALVAGGALALRKRRNS